MKSKFNSSFIFTTCQVGAESTLKKEIASEGSGWAFAFSRPGFVTFKQTEDKKMGLDFQLPSIFARSYGLSAGILKNPDYTQVIEFAEKLSDGPRARKIRLHVWERDFHKPGEEPKDFVPGRLAAKLEKQVRALKPDLFEEVPKNKNKAEANKAHDGEIVLDLIALEEDQISMGAHVQTYRHSPWAGGLTPIVLPPNSPSRAYLKLEESLLWSGAPVRSGDTALEIGSAPGGATLALLNRGLKVVGIDPGEMDPRILKHPQFRHVKQPVANVLRETLPDSIEWLLVDMNVEPRISLFAVDRLSTRMKDSLLGVILTLKLNQWKTAGEIPGMLEHVRVMGMSRIKVAQLSHHRQEILVYGLTRKGITRKT